MDSEYPDIVTMHDGPFSDLHKAGVPLAECVHRDLEKRFGMPGNRSRFSVSIGNKSRSGVGHDKGKTKGSASRRKNRDITKIHQLDTAEALSTTGMPSSPHQCMVT